MKILALRIRNFGKYSEKTIELKDGINLIYGKNESGKSTIHNFIQGMLFGIEKQRGRASKEDIYLKYQPWDHPSTYGGSLDLEYKEKSYRIFRNFNKDNREYNVVDLVTGRDILVPNIKGVSFINGLTEENYRNTISIEQLKARTDKELADEVRNHMTNLSMSKSNQVNVSEAVRILVSKKKQIESNQTEIKLSQLQDEIKEYSLEEKKKEELSSRIKELEGMFKQETNALPNEDIEKIESFIAEFPGIREKYKQYLRLSEQKKNLENTLLEVNKLAKENSSANELCNQQEKKTKGISGINQFDTKEYKKNYIVYLMITIAIILGVLFFKGIHKDSAILIGSGIILTWGVFFIMNGLHGKGKKKTATIPDTIIDSTKLPTFINIQESERIQNSIADFTKAMLEEEHNIISYGSRISQITKIEESSMNELEKEIIALKDNLIRMKEDSRKKNEGIRIELERLRWELEVLCEQESFLYEKRLEYQELKEKLQEEEKDLQAIRISIDMINQISSNIHDHFGQNLNEVMSKIIMEQTKGKYSNIKVDEKLNVKVAHKDRFVEIDKLSIGTIEQIYLALRLSIARIIFQEEKMPLLFDDTFAYYDEERLSATLEYLAKEKDRQILLFTCHKREEGILKELNIPFHKISLT